MDGIVERKCNGCDLIKPISNFCKDKYRYGGYSYRCKSCRAKYQRDWVRNNPEKVKILNDKHKATRKEFYNNPENKLKYRKLFIEKSFRILYEDYEKMQIEQNNLCYICKNPETSTRNNYLCVDHNHETGKIRGLLCNSCNRALGYFKDNITLLQNAINYLNLKN